MRRTTYRFQEIRRSRTVDAVCRCCGVKRKRTVSDFQTVNPFNVDESGAPKSPAQIERELSALLTAKVEKIRATGIVCRKCESTAGTEG